MSLQFKTARIRDEWAQLGFKNQKLVDLIIDLADYASLHYKQDLTLTSIYRDAAEQAELYAQSARKVVNSPHSTWEAVDVRSLVFKKPEVDEMVSYLNTKYKNANGKIVALFHTIPGNAPHFHLQLFRA
jgi:hypothetical protein